MFGSIKRLWQRNRWVRIAFPLGCILVLTVVLYSIFRSPTSEALYAEVRGGAFEVQIVVQGELETLSSVDITGPTELMRSRNFKITEITIKDLVPEGTIVDSGDYVGALDKDALSNQLKSLADDVEKAQLQLLKMQLDTTLSMSELRVSLQNLIYEKREHEIVLEQSKYEPPTTIRQAELNLEKTERSLRQTQESYKLKSMQARATMREAQLNLEKVLRQQEELKGVLEHFTIHAPQHGMVIYAKEWDGKKRKVGSKISQYDGTVATLPDLSVMVSKTYVNEIDISKVKVGQTVSVSVDAFPDRRYRGVISEIANVGEQVPGSDAKVFEVMVRVQEQDSILRPSMTTSNAILVLRRDSTLFCPLECLYTNDSLSYVCLASGLRQEVKTGASNDRDIEILRGLKLGDKLYLSAPVGVESFSWSLLRTAQ